MSAPTPRRRRTDATPSGGVLELLATILAGQPQLVGAACRGHVETFDAAADGCRDSAEAAVAICRACPVIDSCAAWIARAHPRRPPPGVWAGTHQPPTAKRKD